MTAEYRFFGLTADQTRPSADGPGHYRTTTDDNHSILLGVRYAFNAAPPSLPSAPAAVAAPAPAPARTYLVFFDWDKSDLTDRARRIVAEAAQASTHVT